MKITKKKWRKIQDYLCDNSKEIWKLAIDKVDNVAGAYNAVVWLHGIKEENFRLSAAAYKIGTEIPVIKDSLWIYKLPYNWYKDFIGFLYPKDVFAVDSVYVYEIEYDVDEVISRLYDTGYEYFFEEMGESSFWNDIIKNNHIELTGGEE